MLWKGRYPRTEGGASRPGLSEHGPRRAARSRRRPICRDGAHGRMEWRVEGSRHRLDGPPSACRSLPIQQARSREQGLWGTITLLSLFAGAVMASSETWYHNQTLGAASGSMSSASSASMEENSMETPSLAVWNHWHGENMTIQELSTSELLRAERSPSSSSSARKGSRRAGRGNRGRYCRLHSLRMKVRDLGLGYDSDEVVKFKYCSGSCQRTRTNYDLTLSHLIKQHAIVPGPHSSQPCCRPTRYENFSFMDVHNVWKTLDKVSAAECGCVG
ncbi:artemin [Candoia aspera]|uniref:artemin n=1 Tax=Candoia aspera TaxID=51853 RepID=UPI002FD7A6CD